MPRRADNTWRRGIMIKSATPEIRSLIEALDSPSPARRESAAARLAILGARAVAGLVAAFAATRDRQKQVAILGVLEISGDERALPAARAGLAAGGDVAVAAIAVLRALLDRGSGNTHAHALELLLTASSEATRERRVRAAAIAALTNAPDDVGRAVAAHFPVSESDVDVVWEDAARGRLPESPGALADAIDHHAAAAPLPVLAHVLDAVRGREEDLLRGDPADARVSAGREGWCAVRGLLHQVLAARGSRLALYDLRETFQAAGAPLPAPFIAALESIGDASCLEPLAVAFTRAPHQRAGWRRQLAAVFESIARRERLTKRHAAVRRALQKAPALAAALTPSQAAGELIGQ